MPIVQSCAKDWHRILTHFIANGSRKWRLVATVGENAKKGRPVQDAPFLLFVVGVVNKSNYSAYDKSRRDNGKSPSEHDARRKCNT